MSNKERKVECFGRMKKKPLVEFNDEVGILSEIGEIREKIHSMIDLDKSNVFDNETVKISQYLDKLIVEYTKGSKGKRSGEKVLG